MSGITVQAGSIDRFPNARAFLQSADMLLDYAVQPIVDAHSGDPLGYEALVRNVGQLGFQAPLDVFDFAAQIGALAELELNLRKKAIDKFAALRDCSKLKLFLNVDARLLKVEGYLLDETVYLLEAAGLNSSQVVFEISEMRDVSGNQQQSDFARRGRRSGFSFAIDDYGRGYSQLQTLYDLEPEILKIDRFFITDINTDSRKRILVKTVVDLAHQLGIRVVAEGIETVQELMVTREVGCDLVQGYLIARPFQDLTEALPRYTTVSAVVRKSQVISRDDAELIRREVKPLVPLLNDAKMENVLTLLRTGRANPFIPVINKMGEPCGLIRESDVKSFVYMPFGQDLLRNPIMSNTLHAFTHLCPTANINTPLDQLVSMIADEDDETGGIIITKSGKYHGFLTTTSLLKISNEVRLRAAENRNPLTKLPGNSLINQFVHQNAHDPDAERSFCYLDFDNFKPFNDIYGFTNGDRALLLFAQLLKRLTPSDRIFAGQIGGDDFFVGTLGYSVEQVREMISALQEEFRHQAESLYDPEDRLKGFIEARDRHGVTRQFPLLSCSAGILYLPTGLSVDPKDILGRQIAGLKSQAKRARDAIAVATFGQLLSPHDPSALVA